MNGTAVTSQGGALATVDGEEYPSIRAHPLALIRGYRILCTNLNVSRAFRCVTRRARVKQTDAVHHP